MFSNIFSIGETLVVTSIYPFFLFCLNFLISFFFSLLSNQWPFLYWERQNQWLGLHIISCDIRESFSDNECPTIKDEDRHSHSYVFPWKWRITIFPSTKVKTRGSILCFFVVEFGFLTNSTARQKSRVFHFHDSALSFMLWSLKPNTHLFWFLISLF